MIEQATAPSSKAAEDASLPAPDTEANSEPPTSAIGILTYPFLACLILTGIHCYLGIHVIARGVIFVDLALAQMAALGGVVALLIGLEPHPHGKEPYWLEAWASYSLSLATTLVGAALFATGRLKKQVVPQEAIIGIIYAVSSALALLLLSKAPSEQAEETKHMLVGRLLFVQDYEVWKMAALYAGVGLFHWIFRQRFLAISLHPELAQEQGMAVRWWDFLFYTSFGVVVTSSVRMAGVLLVFSFLIVPAVCATLLARNIGTRLVVGWAIGFMASVLGLSFSVLFDLPTGESVVTAFGGLLAIVALARWVLPRTAT
ncbi:MAG: metal ABC transporter permease [Planctomycetes bacterium]|nr:metal ABC transporter permease [Planctomycetota bacterium]